MLEKKTKISSVVFINGFRVLLIIGHSVIVKVTHKGCDCEDDPKPQKYDYLKLDF